MSPEAYGGEPGSIVRIDTHCAVVFLAGERAYKLKRAVKLPYLDYSTLKQRHEFCEREMMINRLTSPQLYLAVVPVTREKNGRLAIDGGGVPVDWLVVMRRFDNNLLFDHLASTHQLSSLLLTNLAIRIREFHSNTYAVYDAPWVESFQKVVGDLETTLCGENGMATGLQCHPHIEALRRTVDDLSSLMLAREEAGYVRHCHGDLHLKNIVLLDDEPVLFDAIEFDDKLTNIDVLYDLAFLLMDLWHRGLRREANKVFNQYFQRDVPADEWAGLALLPMFIAVRAGVRAMVGIHGLSLAKDAQARAEDTESIHSYAHLAADALSPTKTRLIAVGGFSGTGKTTLARAIVPEVGSIPGAIHIRSDVERKIYHGVDLLQHLPPEYYTPESREVVYQHIIERAEAALSAGHSVILDAVFYCADWRERVQQMAERAGASFCGLWLEADPVQMMARVATRIGDASDANPQVVAEQLQSASIPDDWHKIDTRGPMEATVKAATSVLEQTA